MFTYANVVHREHLKLFACFEQGSIKCVFLLESGSLAESPFAPF